MPRCFRPQAAHPIMAAALLIGAAWPSAAFSQPESKLIRGLDEPTIATMWCSALFFEESFWHDEGSDWSYYYDDLAYILENDLHDGLMEAGLGEAEVDEAWAIFDDAAMALSESDEAAFLAQLEAGGGGAVPPAIRGGNRGCRACGAAILPYLRERRVASVSQSLTDWAHTERQHY